MLLVDLDMPHIDGLELLRMLREERPALLEGVAVVMLTPVDYGDLHKLKELNVQVRAGPYACCSAVHLVHPGRSVAVLPNLLVVVADFYGHFGCIPTLRFNSLSFFGALRLSLLLSSTITVIFSFAACPFT